MRAAKRAAPRRRVANDQQLQEARAGASFPVQVSLVSVGEAWSGWLGREAASEQGRRGWRKRIVAATVVAARHRVKRGSYRLNPPAPRFCRFSGVAS